MTWLRRKASERERSAVSGEGNDRERAEPALAGTCLRCGSCGRLMKLWHGPNVYRCFACRFVVKVEGSE